MISNISKRALGRYRILDMTNGISGPYCTKLLAEMGAEVIKLEKPGEGDPCRKVGPFLKEAPHGENSSLHFYLNTGKKSVTLDIKQNTGKRIFKELVAEADALIEDFDLTKTGSLEMTFETLLGINPRLVLTSLSGFGREGQYKDWKMNELVAIAMGGLAMSSFGTPERHPIKPFGSIVSHFAGIHAAIGTMLALLYSQTSSAGQRVEISMFDCASSMDAHQFPMFFYENRIRKREASLHPTNHPMSIFPCKDGYLGFAIGTPEHWQRLCLIAGLPETWMDDNSPFRLGLYRREHYQEINEAMRPWLMSHTRLEIEEMAKEVMIPINGVKTVTEALDDEQYKARKFFVEIRDKFNDNFRMPGMPFKMSLTPGEIKQAPTLGEHNREVICGDLKYSSEDLVKMCGMGVV